jgi:multidrug efflux pump subunit AcrB
VRRIIAWFVSNPVSANLLMVAMVAGGLFAAPRLPQKTWPDIDLQIVAITVPYPGAAPEEVEQGVCVPIEEEIASVEGIDKVRSTASEGRCGITAELFYDADADLATAEIRNRVGAITVLPEEAEKPIISKALLRRAVVDVAVSGDVGEDVLKRLGQKVRDEIAALPEVTQVELTLDRPYEVSIEVPEESLRRFGLSFDQVVRAVRRSSLDLPGGSIKAGGGEILLRSIGQAYRGLEFEDIVVLTRADGTRLTLGEIARVVDGFEDNDVSGRFDGEPAVIVRAYRVGKEGLIDISDAVKAYIAETTPRLPEGVRLTVWRDSSIQLRARLDTLFRNGRSGLILVFAILALFLRFRLAIWVSVGVPIAFLGALAVLPILGGSIDQVSLFAFILVLGILVDDAIVVGESVYTSESRTGDRRRASVEGTQEVCVPVIFGVLTTVAAFVPLLVVPGRMGQMFFFMGATVIACLAYSVFESQLVLPSHLSHGRSKLADAPRTPARNPVRRRWEVFQERFARGLQRFTEEYYRPSLQRAMAWRYLSVSVGLALLVLTGAILGSGRLNFTFFPPVEADYIAAHLTMPQGTPAQVTGRGVARLQAAADELARELDPRYAPRDESLVRHTFVSMGKHAFRMLENRRGRRDTGGHVAEVVLELVPSEERDISTRDIAQRWRELTGQIPDVTELTFETDLFTAGNPIDIQLRGSHGARLAEAAEAVKAKLTFYPGVFDIADSFRPGKRELQLEILPEAEPLGLTMEDLAHQVRQAFYGAEAQRIQRGRDDVRVMVRYPEAERRSLADLENMRIRGADGAEVPLFTVARARFGRGFADIRRADRERVVYVTADLDRGRANANEVLADLRERVLPKLLEQYPGVSVAFEGEHSEQGKALSGLIRAFGGALLAIYALLAIPLGSYLQPLVIMSVIPFGVVGAVGGHLLLGRDLCFPSVLGFVALSGVVVNASLVLVDYVNRRRAEGAALRAAVEMAGVARFRPIVLTAATTFVGLTPLMLEGSLQAQALIPMAVSLAFGVIFATAITLLLVPCGYLILEDIARWLRGLRGGSGRRTAGPRPVGARDEAA